MILFSSRTLRVPDILLPVLVTVCLVSGFFLPKAHATPSALSRPYAAEFAAPDAIIKNYFEIRGLNITFEILPLKSFVALQKAYDIKGMSNRKRGSREQLLQLAQAYRDSSTDRIHTLLYLKDYGLIVNEPIWRQSLVRDWRKCGTPGSTDIQRRILALRHGCTNTGASPPPQTATQQSRKKATPQSSASSSPSVPASPPQIGAGLGIPRKRQTASAGASASGSSQPGTATATTPAHSPGASVGLGLGLPHQQPSPKPDNLDLASEASRSYHFDRNREQMPEADMAMDTETLFAGGDRERAAKLLAEEEELTAGAGDGSRIVITNVSAPEQPVLPESRITVRVTVQNNAERGPPAVFELGIWNYHENNRTVVRRRGLRLAPGASDSYSLSFPAPRAEMFGGYVYLDPLNDSRPEYPTTVLNIDVAWDKNTMADAEITAMLRDRIPDMRFSLSDADAEPWIAAYRDRGQEAVADFQQHVMTKVREMEEQERLAYLNDPDFIADMEAALAAEANTRRLAEYDMQHAWAVRQGELNGIDLVSILEDHVYIDDNARVHGNIQAARGAMLTALSRANAATTSVDRFLMDYGDTTGTTRTYAETEPYMTPALATSGFVGMEEGLLTHMSDRRLQELMSEYKNLLAEYRKADTNPIRFQKDLQQLRTRFEFTNKRLGQALTGRAQEVYRAYHDKVASQLNKMDNVITRAREFQNKADLYLRRSRGVRLVSKGLEKMGDAWNWYDLYEKANARVQAGEDMWAAFGKEYGVFKLKALVGKVPVVGAADAVMTAAGQVLYHRNKEMWDELGIDPRQYNASTLVDMGGGLSFSYVEDRMLAAGGRSAEFRMSPEERQLAEQRLQLLEERMETATDPTQLERLGNARKMLREVLREGM